MSEIGTATGADQSQLVLASTSTYRRALLARLGVPFRCETPRFEESSISATGRTPRELAEALARGKAESVARGLPEATVIGCDQLVALGARVLGKPGSTERAIDQLEALAGRQHELITSFLVLRGGREFAHTDVTRLWMRPLSREEIERYVRRDQPVDCAGSYKLEQAGITLFERIESDDQTAITGLPLIALTSVLRGLGFAMP